MYFHALATDYDGTIAHHGKVSAETEAALQRFKDTGRRLILVTGRELPDLRKVFPDVRLFDRIVAENGALIVDPATGEERTIAPPPPPSFVERLKARDVGPISVGRSIVATWEPHERTVLEVIRDMGLELQIIFNKGAVMVLPAGVNKAVGLEAALRELGLSAANVVAVGDAENDHAFLRACGCGAAVANALESVKEDADIRLAADHGAGVIELVNLICRDDAAIVPAARHGLLVGETRSGAKAYLEPHRGSVLIAGQSGIGKSTLATALTERMVEKRFEFCVLDPEGDYGSLEHAVSIGDAKNAPSPHEALELIRKRAANVVINTQALGMRERPRFFAELLPEIASLRAATGRPHWLLIDEAHHLLSAERADIAGVLPDNLAGTIFITVHPDTVARSALESVRYVLALGQHAHDVVDQFCGAIDDAPPGDMPPPEGDEILFIDRFSGANAQRVRPIRPRQQHKRHTRKYADGEFGEPDCFYFRGPQGKLKLRAHNLVLFARMGEGVDDDTWEHHRRQGDYSAWFRRVIHDDGLADEAAAIEADDHLDAAASRKRILAAIEQRYTAPARAPEQ